MNINIKIKVTLLALTATIFSVLVFNTGVIYAANSYTDCDKFDDKAKKQNCEDEVYKQKLKDCKGKNPTDKEVKQCEEAVPKQPYVVAKDKDNNSNNTQDKNAEFVQDLSKREQEMQGFSCDQSNLDDCVQKNPIVKWLNYLINIIAGVVGVGAVLMLIWGGIQYITARDNAQGVADAKQKIINVVIGLAAFIFLYAFLNWLIPGGVFK
jgi:hypothetical protein